jgi:hypothetical protein
VAVGEREIHVFGLAADADKDLSRFDQRHEACLPRKSRDETNRFPDADNGRTVGAGSIPSLEFFDNISVTSALRACHADRQPATIAAVGVSIPET